MKSSLLILAAGMGSRYGSLKQMDGFGPNDETIIDYSIYDAIQAGFTKIVFVVRNSFREQIEKYYRSKIGDRVELCFVEQELDKIPSGHDIHPERVKPWGTAHAVLVGQSVIDEPFAVINADDYYGRESYQTLIKYFSDNTNHDEYAVVSYLLNNTLSDHGTVNRGVCHKDESNFLTKIVETLKIARHPDGSITYPDGDSEQSLDSQTLVSMNMFGFYPNYFSNCERYFNSFLKEKGMELKSEFFIPLLLDKMINNRELKVKVLTSPSKWFGVTYKEDKPFVIEKINALIANGVYPNNLWA